LAITFILPEVSRKIWFWKLLFAGRHRSIVLLIALSGCISAASTDEMALAQQRGRRI